ncbi:MAG: hypothetical protein HY720_04660 [Planctomycetes bacterium]|nr:hypothetical protein [Planctomycetota bacterium]
MERKEAVYRFRGTVTNRLEIPVRDVRVEIVFASVPPPGVPGRPRPHRVEGAIERIPPGGTGAFEVEYRTDLAAYRWQDRPEEPRVASYEIGADDPGAVARLIAFRPDGSLPEFAVREACRRFMVAIGPAQPERLRELLDEATRLAPPDPKGYGGWLAALLAAERLERESATPDKDRPELDVGELLHRLELEGEANAVYGELHASLLVRSYLVEGLATVGPPDAASSVLALAAALPEVPATATLYFRAAGERVWPVLAAGVRDARSARAADAILDRLGVHPPVRLLDAADRDVRLAVMEAFAKGRYEAALVRLGRMGSEPDREIALAAARTVRAIGGPNAGVLADFADSPHAEVRAEAESGLADLGGAAAAVLRERLAVLGSRPPGDASTRFLQDEYVGMLRIRRASRVEAKTARARERFAAGEAEAAVEELEGVVAIDAESTDHLELLGAASLDAGTRALARQDAAEASRLLRRAWSLIPARREEARIPLYRAERARLVGVALARGAAAVLEEEPYLVEFLGTEESATLVADCLARAAVTREAAGEDEEALRLLAEARARRATADVEGQMGRVLVRLGLAHAREAGPEAPNESFDRVLSLDWADDSREEIASFHIDRAEEALSGSRYAGVEFHLEEADRFGPDERARGIRFRMAARRRWMAAAAALALFVLTCIARAGTRP